MSKEITERVNDRVGTNNDENVVGLEKHVDELLKRAIFNDEQGRSISIITGMVGIGKTTLVRQVYNHAAVTCMFKQYWVSVSSDLDFVQVLEQLMQQVLNSDKIPRYSESLFEHMDILERNVHRHLEGQRYFIVLDDIRTETRLEFILRAFPNEARGSRLLLTSRTQNIQAGIHYTHEMKTLDPDQSWNMFCKTLFSGNKFMSRQEFPKKLEKKGREMLRKCGHLPLAITEVGRQLAKKRLLGIEWEQLFESVDFDAVLGLLQPFYVKMESVNKACFLHLPFFKENTTMRAGKLVQIWALAGILPKAQTRSYLLGLINESIIEVKDRSTDNEIRSCSLNAILHRLSIKKAVKEIGFEILGRNGSNRPSQSLGLRHRVIRCSRDEFDHITNENKHLVSLFFHGGGYFDESSSYWKSFELLNILDFEEFGLKVVPETIGTLEELKYLGLRNNYLLKLPRSLRCLKKLFVFDIALNFTVEVPDIIWEMGSLRHLYMFDVICRKPLKIDALENLETLAYISVDNWEYEISSLKMMTRLRKLGIEELDGNSDVRKLFASMAKLLYLQSLTLKGFHFRRMPSLNDLGLLQNVTKVKLYGVLAKIPSSFPRCIRYLKLVNSRLDEDPMPKLPTLRYLKLRNAYTGRQMKISWKSCHDLEVFCIQELENLRDIHLGVGLMCKLKRLEIVNCPYLENLPIEIGSMNDLQELKMVTTEKIARKIRKSSLISKIKIVNVNT